MSNLKQSYMYGGGQTLLYKNSMVTAKQKSVFDVHTKKEKENA